MEKMDSEPRIIDNNSDMMAYIESVILKYRPIDEKRYLKDILPEFNISITNKDGNSQISFFNDIRAVYALGDKAIVTHTSSFDEIVPIVDYILDDHDWIVNIVQDGNRCGFVFGINWTEKTHSGIGSDRIMLSVGFESAEEKKACLESLIAKYYDVLKSDRNTMNWINWYYESDMEEFYAEKGKDELLAFLSQLDEEAMRTFLVSSGYDTYLKSNPDAQKKPDIRKLENQHHGNREPKGQEE